MLPDQHFSRGRYHHLLTRQRHESRRAQGNFGLAVTDIADDQPVHRLATFQLVADHCDRLGLIGGLSERERGDDLFVACGVELDRLAVRASRSRAISVSPCAPSAMAASIAPRRWDRCVALARIKPGRPADEPQRWLSGALPTIRLAHLTARHQTVSVESVVHPSAGIVTDRLPAKSIRVTNKLRLSI